jgi:phage-related protein
MDSSARDRPIVWLHGEIKTPPFSVMARLEAGFMLRRLQRGEKLEMPHSRTMFAIGSRCHELRITDGNLSWRIVYRTDPDAIVILAVFAKKTNQTPKRIIDLCRKRLRDYDDASG